MRLRWRRSRAVATSQHLKARSANPTSAMPQRGHNGASGAKGGSGPLWAGSNHFASQGGCEPCVISIFLPCSAPRSALTGSSTCWTAELGRTGRPTGGGRFQSAKLDDGGKTVKYLDIGDKFLEPDGTLSKDIMPDFLHLSPKGYQIWTDAVKGPIEELMGKKK